MATLGFKAKEENLHDDLDEFDFDSFDFNVAEPPDDRHPIMKTLSPVGAGMKDYVTNSSNIEKFVKAAMPVGYGQGYDLVSEAGGELKQLYHGVQNELRPVKETAKSLLRKVLPVLDGKIPKKIKEKLEEMSAEETQYQGRQGDSKEDQLQQVMSTIFEQKETDKLQQRDDINARDKIKQGFEQIRHRDEMGQLDAIRTGTESLVQYQNKITYNVQKKQLELSYRQFWAMAELNKEQKRSNAELLTELKATRMNTGLPDFVKQVPKERFKEIMRNKFLDSGAEAIGGMFGGAKDYVRKFTKNIGQHVMGRVKDYSATLNGAGDLANGVSDMAGGMGDMPGMNMRDEMIRMGTSLPMDFLAEKGGKVLAKILGKNSKLRRGSSKISHFVNTAGDRMSEQLNDPEKRWKYGLESLREMLSSAAPSSTPESRMEVDTLNKAHEPKPFNRANSKSLDEVIPGLLARIHREIKILRTGDEKTELVSYDFVKNKFSTEKKIGNDLRQRIAGAHTERASKYANNIINKVNRGKTLTPQQIELARKQLIKKSVMGESVDSTKTHLGDHWGGGEDGQAIADAFSKYTKAKDGKLPDNHKSFDRQLSLIRDHRSIVGSVGDPRVLIQQMVNAGQLESLKGIGILDENNNLDRKVFAEWLSNNKPAPDETVPSEPPIIPQPTPPIPQTIQQQPQRNRVHNPQLPTINLPGPVNETQSPNPTPPALRLLPSLPSKQIINLQQLSQRQQPSPLVNNERIDEILKELRTISEKIVKPSGSSAPNSVSTVEKNVQSITELLQSLDSKYTKATEDNEATLAQMLLQLESIAKGSSNGNGNGNAGDNGNNQSGPGLRDRFKNMQLPSGYTSLYEHLKASAGETFQQAKDYAIKGKDKAKEVWDKYSPTAKKLGKDSLDYAGEKITNLKGRLAGIYGDIIVSGENMPRLRASLLKAGEYRDKATGKVITSLDDIKGDVIDSAGNVVITLDEFYNSYISGNVNKKVKEIFTSLKSLLGSAATGLKTFVPAQLQNLKAFAQSAFKKVKDLLPPYDVYVKTDMSKPLLYASAMKYGKYLSKKTQKVIKHPRDIDGEVTDEKGNILVNEDHLKDGLVDISGIAVGSGLGRLLAKGAQFAGAGLAALRVAASGIGKALGKGATGVKDWFKDFTVPFSEIITNSKKTVNWLEKIHQVLDTRLPNKGKKVKGDMDGDGIRDGSIEDIHLKKEKAKKDKQDEAAIKSAAERGSASTNGTLTKLFSSLFGKKKKAEEGEEGEEGEKEKSMLDQAKDVYDAFKGDKQDGEAPAEDNSPEGKKKAKRAAAKERLKRMRESARVRERAAREPGRFANRIGGTRIGRRARGIGNLINNPLTRGIGRTGWGAAKMLGRGALATGGALMGDGIVGRVARGGMYNTSILRGAGSVLGGVGSVAGGVGSLIGRAGGVGGLLGKAGWVGSALGGAATIGSTLMDDTKSKEEKVRDVTDTGASMVGGIAGAKAGAMAGAAAGSFVPIVGTAIGGIIGGLAGGAIGYWGGGALSKKARGFSAWWNKPKLSNLSTLRLAQYGVDAGDMDGREKVFQLESMLESHVTVQEDGNIILDEKAIDLKEISALFNVGEPQELQLFNGWYKRRFVPVYRKWLGIIRKIKPDGKLADVETIIPGKEKLKIAEESVPFLVDAYSFMTGWSKAHLRLTVDGDGVKTVMESIRIELAKDVEAAGGAAAKGIGPQASVASTTKDAVSLAQKALTDKASYVTKDKDGKVIDAASMNLTDLTEKIKKGDVTVSVGVALPANLLFTGDPTQLDALTSIRFKAYGLKAMTADKCRMLGALENFLGDNVSTEGGSPKLTIGTDQVLKIAGDVFGVSGGSGEHAERWRAWFNGRFLPVFLLYAGTLREKTGKKKLVDAMQVFPMVDQSSLARAIIGAQGMSASGASTVVWNVSSNPWSDPYELNDDPDSTASNMEAIRLVADKVRLGEVTAKNGKVQETGKANQEKGFWANTKSKIGSWFGMDDKPKGEGVKATGDTMSSKDAKPLAGVGDPVSFTGGSGNYTELPTSAGAGWSGNKDLITKAAVMAGVDPRALITTIAVESSFDPNAAPKNSNLASSAKGFGQHLDSSWKEDLERDGKKFGIPNGTNQFDPRASVLMTASRLRFNGQQLTKNLGRSVTTTDLYLAHLMGLGGATKFLKSPEDAIGAEVGGAAAKQHPNYFYKGNKALTVKEVYAGFAAKLAKRPAELGVTDADMSSKANPDTSTAKTTAEATPQVQGTPQAGVNVPMKGNAPVAQAAAPTTAPATQKASFANTPAAGTPQLNGPVQMDKGKSAVMGKGVPMVNGNGAVYELILQREESEEDGMFGTLRFPDGTVLNSLELPWRDNAASISSIPPGTYTCKKRPSASFGSAYEVQKVPGRSAILIHAGNSAGSADKGMKADSQGCILLGMDRGKKGVQKVITASKAAMALFHDKMGDQPFTLTIRPGKDNIAVATAKPAVNFDPVRAKATADTTAKPTAGPTVNFKPNATAPTTGVSQNSEEASPTVPRMNPTRTSFTPGVPSKTEMQNRDQAISETISPKLDGISGILDKSLKAHETGVNLLGKILESLTSGKGVSDPTPTPKSADKMSTPKITPVTNTAVPISQKRNY